MPSREVRFYRVERERQAGVNWRKESRAANQYIKVQPGPVALIVFTEWSLMRRVGGSNL